MSDPLSWHRGWQRNETFSRLVALPAHGGRIRQPQNISAWARRQECQAETRRWVWAGSEHVPCSHDVKSNGGGPRGSGTLDMFRKVGTDWVAQSWEVWKTILNATGRGVEWCVVVDWREVGRGNGENWAEGLVGPVGGDGTCVNDDIGRMAENHLWIL